MPGLRIRRPDTGAVILELTDRITRLFGTVVITSANKTGSYTYPGSDGIPWYHMRLPPGVQDPATSQSTYPPSGDVTRYGRVLSWTNVPVGTQIVVGVY